MSAAAWDFAPAASPAWRPRRRRVRRGSWAWWLAAALHAVLLAALFADIDPETLPEPRVLEGTPLVWEGPVGAAEGAPELSPDRPAAPPEAPAPSAPADPPPEVAAPSAAAPSPADPVAAASGALAPGPAPEAEAPAREAAPPVPAAEALPAAPPQPAPPRPPARAVPAEALPLPPPAAPPAPARPAATAPPPVAAPPAAPATGSAPLRTVEVPLAASGAIRLGAGAAGAPGESRVVGAPQPGCQDMIGYPPSERARGITGGVNLRLRVSDDGRVVEARIVEPSGSFALDEAARSGIRRCRFIPALRDGIAVWGSRDYRVVFRLD